MIKCILFDIDGTLISTGGAGVKAFELTFQSAFGLPNATRHLNFSGRTDSGLVRECFLSHGIQPSQENFQKFYDRYVFVLHEQLLQLQGAVCPGVETFLTSLRKSEHPILLGLLTGNIRLGAEIKLRHYHLWDYFITGAFGDDNEDRNCLARLAQTRAERVLGQSLQGHEILVIGDTPLDIACARSIGAKVLAVATGNFKRDQLEKHSPDLALDSLPQFSGENLAHLGLPTLS